MTRPSLQFGRFWRGRSDPVATAGFVLHTEGGYRGTCANSRHCGCSRPAALAPGCPGSRGRSSAFLAAICAAARSDNADLSNKSGGVIAIAVEISGRSTRSAWFAWSFSIRNA